MVNRVVLVGRLVRDVELRYTSNGTAVGSFTLAVNRNYADQSGQRQTDFINCVIWRKPAETLSKYTGKGSLLAVEGRIQTRSYENNNGQRVYITEIVVDNYTFLETKAESETRRSQKAANEPQPFANNNNAMTNPFADPSNSGVNQNPFESTGNAFQSSSMGNDNPFALSDDSDDGITLSDDDLPF